MTVTVVTATAAVVGVAVAAARRSLETKDDSQGMARLSLKVRPLRKVSCRRHLPFC